MLTLMLLRHAKAAPLERGDDFARPLLGKGEADALRLGRFLADADELPTYAYVSTAARTRGTFEQLQKGAKRTIPAAFEDSLFNATASDLRDMLRRFGADRERVMIVGHNPAIVEAASNMSRDGDITEIARMRNRFPPCTLAVLTFDTDDWLDARAGGRLDRYVVPEDLAAP